jgi:hypothetical protein
MADVGEGCRLDEVSDAICRMVLRALANLRPEKGK